MEENVPEQGPGQFPTQAANDGWLRGWFPAFISELPSSVSSTLWYETHLQSSPWVIEMEVDTLTLLSSRFNASSAQRGGRGPSTLCTKESLPAPGGVQGSTEHTLKKEVVKDPVRFWQFSLHNLFFWVNAMFSDGPQQ